MKPTSRLRLRRLTALLAILWALIALGAGIRADLSAADRPTTPFRFSGAGNRYVVHRVSPAAAEAGIRAGARLLAVDGVELPHWLLAPEPRLIAGRSNLYQLLGPDGRSITAALPPQLPEAGGVSPERVLRLVILLVATLYLTIGISIWRLHPERSESWALLLFSSAMAAELFTSGEAWGAAVGVMGALNVPLLGATAAHLFTTYPFEPEWSLRSPQLRVVPYAIAALLVGLSLIELSLGTTTGLAGDLSLFFLVGVGSICTVGLALQRWQRRQDELVARSTVALLGAAASFIPPLLAVSLQYLRGSTLPWTATLPSLALFPLTVGYGIVRNQLFDLRGAARGSFAYGAATLVITGLFALLITFASTAFDQIDVNARSPIFSIAFLFFAILLFNPVRSRVQRVVDRFFDRDRAAYRRAVREISEAMVSMLAISEIVERILVAVTDTMGVEHAMVLLREGDEERVPQLRTTAVRGDWDEAALGFVLAAGHPLSERLAARRDELTRADFDREEDPELRESCRDVFDSLEAELLVPILFGGDLLGVIAVGRKLSGDRLGADDRQLLRTLANQSAIAIENAQAFEEIAELNATLEARVERRTSELRGTQAQLLQSEKMRTLGQLVAGVAHELNNPIAFVHANLQLIDEYLERIEGRQLDAEERERLRAAVHKLLARSREGTSRVKQIVQDLRTFSRTDEAEIQEVDLNEEIDRTLTLMESRLGQDIRVERDYGSLPRVRCFAGQLNQVFLNLLVNACDAIDGKGRIRIRTRAQDGGVRLEFSDDGPGIPPEILGRVFEPFFTTKEVGRGTGLGLSLSHGIVERHGGRLAVHSEPGGGATFTVELPREARPEGPAPRETG